MSIIKTKHNYVAAYEPMADDVAVVTKLGTAQAVQPIAEYDKAVQMAVAVVNHMESPAEVVPVTTGELIEMHGMTPEEFVASLTPAERDLLRQDAIAACESALLHCDDSAVVAQARDTLLKLQAQSGIQAH